MRTVALFEMLFGLVALIGGIIGYVSADSTASLIAGSVSGIILIYAGLRMQKGARIGLYISLIVTLALLGRFGYKFFMDNAAFMPAGLMSLLSIISVVLLVLVMVQPAERKRDF